MFFNGPIFIFLFLPMLILVYYVTPKKLKNTLLLFASLFFYSFGERELVLIIIFSIFVDYSAAIIIDKGYKKIGLATSLIFNLSLLIYFKYTSFLFENYYSFINIFYLQNELKALPNIVLPLGISFYTFQTMSYTIDVYRGKVKANRNIIDFATFVTFFPQLIAGPIVRYKDIYTQLKKRSQNSFQFTQGIERFIIGLAKKMIIANNLAYVADGIFDLPTSNLSALSIWIGILAYTYQIYYDFSGYSDMAIGLGKMFGFDFPENFNYPYISTSIRDFWHRWHITLSTWFKDYVYISLGGNQKGNIRTYINLIIVFFITGLWHGASWNFIIWGLFHGVFLIIERIGLSKVLIKLPIFLQRIYTFIIVIIGWIIFRTSSINESLKYIKLLFTLKKEHNYDIISYYLNKEILFLFIISLLFSFPLYSMIEKKWQFINGYPYFKMFGLFLLFVISIMYISIDSYNPFIYFRF